MTLHDDALLDFPAQQVPLSPEQSDLLASAVAQIDEERMRRFYLEITAIHSPTGEERELAALIWQEPGKEPEGFNNFDAFGRKWSHHAYANEDWWRRERLFKPDYIIMEWRKLVAKHARAIQTRGDWARMEVEDED